MKTSHALLLGWLAVNAGGCTEKQPPAGDGGAEVGSAPQAGRDIIDTLRRRRPLAPDERILDGIVERPIVIYVEASDLQLEALRDSMPVDDFSVMADDLMVYRSTATQYLEKQPWPYLRITGRRPIRFQVADSVHTFDFADVGLLDFIVVYRPGSDPRVIAPNEAETAAAYFGR